MVEQSKINDALKILKDRDLITPGLWEYNGLPQYKFTDKGKAFIRQKGKGWSCITSSVGSLWVPVSQNGQKTWRYKSCDKIEPSEFNEFCDFFEINLGPVLYDVDDEFDDI